MVILTTLAKETTKNKEKVHPAKLLDGPPRAINSQKSVRIERVALNHLAGNDPPLMRTTRALVTINAAATGDGKFAPSPGERSHPTIDLFQRLLRSSYVDTGYAGVVCVFLTCSFYPEIVILCRDNPVRPCNRDTPQNIKSSCQLGILVRTYCRASWTGRRGEGSIEKRCKKKNDASSEQKVIKYVCIPFSFLFLNPPLFFLCFTCFIFAGRTLLSGLTGTPP